MREKGAGLNKYHIIALVLFLELSIIFNSVPITTTGFHSYYDKNERIDLTGFRADFLTLLKSNGKPDLDGAKRIFFEWIFLIMDEEQFSRIEFPALTFAVLAISYLVFIRLIEDEGYKCRELEKHVIAFTGAFAYMVNPLSLEHYIALYPEVSYALMPAAFYFLYKSMTGKGYRYPVLFGALSAFLVLLVIHNAIYLAVLAALVVGFSVISRKTDIRRAAAVILAAGAVFFALSAFIILPTAYISLTSRTPAPGDINSLEDIVGYGKMADLLKAMLLDINLNVFPFIPLQYPMGNAYYIATAAIVGIILAGSLHRKTRLSLTAAAGFAVFSLLTTGMNNPLGEVYKYVVLNFPFGWLIRAAPRFSFVLPLLFCLMAIHLLATLSGNRRLLAVLCAAVIINQSVFCDIVWSGDMGHGVVKTDAHPDMVGAIESLKRAPERGMVAWYGDYSESSPRETMVATGGTNHVATRYLVDNPVPADTLGQIGQALGIRYVLLDRSPAKPFQYFEYARNAIPDMEDRFSELYQGRRVDVFDLGKDISSMYIPKAVILAHSGYDSVHQISKLAPIGTDIAIMIGDDSLATAPSAMDYADIVSFGPKYTPRISMDKKGVIKMGEDVKISDGNAGWAKGNADLDLAPADWSRSLEQRRISRDVDDYGGNLIFTWLDQKRRYDGSPPRFHATENMTGSIRKEDGEKAFYLEKMPAPVGELEISGRMATNNLGGFSASVYFYDGKGERIGNKTLLGPGKMKRFNITVEVPQDARFMQVWAHGKPSAKNAGVAAENLSIRKITLEPYSFTQRVQVAQSGEYDVLLRVFENPDGGNFSVQVGDNSPAVIDGRSDVSGFAWVNVFSGRLEEGENSMEIMNIEGFNTLNIGYLAPKGEEAQDLSGKGVMYLYEGELDFSHPDAKVSSAPGDSGGLHLGMGKGTKAEGELHIYKQGEYFVKYGGDNVSVYIDAMETGAEPISLGEGEHRIIVEGRSERAQLDYLVVYDRKAKAVMDSLAEGTYPSAGEILEYEKTGRWSYIASLTTLKPALVVVASTHQPEYRADIGGKEVQSIPVYSSVNAFPIKEPGTHSISIYYGPQRYMDAGLVITGISCIVVLWYAVWGWKRD